MNRILISLTIIFFVSAILKAQPELDIKPGDIVFRDLFDRIENVYFINKGDDTLTIDTIYYKSDLYYVRFNEYWHYPVIMEPGDTLLMDCILSGYFNVTSNDTTDTMFVVSNSPGGPEEIRVRINPFEYLGKGHISGIVTDGTNPLQDANVYLLYEGNYIMRTLKTDYEGRFASEVPEGRYTIAAAKDSFYTAFLGNKSEPFSAQVIPLLKDDDVEISIALNRTTYAVSRVKGIILDAINRTALRKAMIVIRRGNHNPKKINAINLVQNDFYTAFAAPDGSFSAEVGEPGYYYIQSFSDYFLPTFYADDNSSVYWQQADSIPLFSYVENKNIFLPRDSSYGAGIVEGKIVVDGASEDSVSDILVFAESIENNFLYGYTFSKNGGTFRLTNLPYGKYRIFGQKIGYEDSYSDVIVEIKPGTPKVMHVYIRLNLSSVDDPGILPESMQLYQNYPNPFNPTTTIEFFIPSGTQATLSIVNVLGEEVKVLYDEYLNRGNYKYDFNAENLSSGTYFVRLKTANKTLVRKILLLK